MVEERETKQTFLKIKWEIVFWKTEFSNTIYALNVLLTTKQPKNDFLIKKRQLEMHSIISKKFQRSLNSFWLFYIFCLFHSFFYHLFTKSHAQGKIISNICIVYCILWVFTYCYSQQMIHDALRDLIPFLQFKKREKKNPWRSVNFSKVAGRSCGWKIPDSH